MKKQTNKKQNKKSIYRIT